MKSYILALGLLSAFTSFAQAEETDEAVITVKLVYNSDIYTVRRVDATALDKRTSEKPKHGAKNTYLKVAPGNYDIHVMFASYTSGSHDPYYPHRHVYRENVEVTGDTTLTMNIEEATHRISFKAYTPEGTEYVHPKTYSGGFDYTNANIISETVLTSIIPADGRSKEHLELLTSFTTQDNRSSLNGMDIYVSDVSENYVFSQSRLARAINDDLYLLTLSTRGSRSADETIVTNKDCEFTKVEPVYTSTPLSDSFTVENFHHGMLAYAFLNEIQATTFTYQSQRPQSPTIYESRNEMFESPAKLTYKVQPRAIEHDEALDDDSRKQVSTHSCPLIFSREGIYYQSDANPNFTWPYENLDGVAADNVPLSCIITNKTTSNGQTVMSHTPTFRGRYGELRESDHQALAVEIFHNGAKVHDSWADFDSWAQEWAANGHTPGSMKLVFTNANTIVDGKIGTNTTELTYTEGKNDICPPAAQMLTFSDSDGRVSQRFLPGQDIDIDLAAGDPNGSRGYISYMTLLPKNIVVEYAQASSGNFKTVGMSQTAQASSSANWDVYSGTITAPDKEGWYDLRLTVTDNEGNRMIQTIAPAFKVASQSGIANIITDRKATIKVENGYLLIDGVENPIVEIFNIDGIKIAESRGNILPLPTTGAAGLCIVKVDGESFKIVLR